MDKEFYAKHSKIILEDTLFCFDVLYKKKIPVGLFRRITSLRTVGSSIRIANLPCLTHPWWSIFRLRNSPHLTTLHTLKSGSLLWATIVNPTMAQPFLRTA